MSDCKFHTNWSAKFGHAFRGLAVSWRGQSSFPVHALAAALVVAAGWWLRVTQIEWCVLLLCITAVFAAELFNTALEYLAKAITADQNPHIRNALDVASGAVLVAAGGAGAIGLVVLATRFAAIYWQN